jgi:cytochrome b involved in lipid metabolism
MNKAFGLIFLGLVLGGCGSTGVNNNPTALVGTMDPGAKSYTAEEVAKHSKEGDCWIVFDGKVFDLSKHPEHPGGKIIFESCGKESTEAFNTKGGIGRLHSEMAKALLNKFYIGDLK